MSNPTSISHAKVAPAHPSSASALPRRYPGLTGARKLVIKNRRTTPVDGVAKAREYFEKTWVDLRMALDSILRGESLQTPMDRLYRGVEGICRDDEAEALNQKLTDYLQEYLRVTVMVEIQQAGRDGREGDEKGDLDLLRAVVANWNLWKTRTRLVRSMFSYLDRSYLLREKLTQLSTLTTTLFRCIIFPSIPGPKYDAPIDDDTSEHDHIGTSVVRAVCLLINADRRDLPIFDSALLKDSISMLHMLHIYTKCFERNHLELSSAYFKEYSDNVAGSSLKEYINACEVLLKRELNRCDVYTLNGSSRNRLADRFYEHMIRVRIEMFMDIDSISHLLDNLDFDTMKLVYELLLGAQNDLNPGLVARFGAPWRKYILTTGSNIICKTSPHEDIIPHLLALRRALSRVIKTSFRSNDVLQHTLRDAFGIFLNDKENHKNWPEGASKIGEFAAKYMDALLRGGIQAVPAVLRQHDAIENIVGDDDAIVDYHLDQALELFRLITGKDAFEAFYKRDLARRLLMDRSISYDAERAMLAKLRSECGANFTHNLEGMFKDKEMSKDEMTNFLSWSETSKIKTPVPTHVLVLSAAAWPTYPELSPVIPAELRDSMAVFEKYYREKHSGRHLQWSHTIGYCVLKARFTKGVHELHVSLFQALVLLLFNHVAAVPDGVLAGEDGFLSYERIAAETAIPADELSRTLQSLACGKHRILIKHPRSRDVSPTDTFSLDLGFYGPKIRIKINQIQARETKKEVEEVHERVVSDRKLEIQATIVRLMKSRRKMTHVVLEAETIKLMAGRGAVDPLEIKSQIEKLIDKDYLERDPTGENVYTYIT